MSVSSPTSNKRSSVVDRIRWIEQTHGSANNTNNKPAPRARLRLPKNFAEVQKASSDDSPPPASAGAQKFFQESRLPKLGQKKAQKEESPSPVLSEASTAIAPLVSSKELGNSSSRSDDPSGDGHSRTVSTSSMASSSSSVEAVTPGTMKTVINTIDEGDECFYNHRNNASSASDLEAADPVHVSEQPTKTALKIKSSVTIIPPGMENRRVPHQQQFKSVTVVSPKPAIVQEEAKKSLGGIRSRTRPMSSRRYNKTTDQPQQQQQQHSRPASPELRASKSLTNLALDISYDDDDDEEENHQNRNKSLISRLSRLKANRPSAQSLVSNWGAPKFVKRSQFSNTLPVDGKLGRSTTIRTPATPVAISFSSNWGRSQRRYK
ncbi:hypothetical protein IW140_005236 [Coemansia sp. RSA 1813]|nr:hypothetical protein EV178_005634 [Coemansia sp. RSA 1646]KAJ1768419.1 hypothetical protein LPJ74_004873 [Coemansia sp. RSA 1843]KAJ2090133.1 hypothetical protein IW138_002943 [Coemansia sp. RSA 986]KAJ2214210.1 hypothetical protein EV179_003230 [Coemansia sp. RSA 487]KAJ2565651.1 hypothetical protein IW140_005236 [Coemansia sp. RSA 1813]